jgi:hypothetical protein
MKSDIPCAIRQYFRNLIVRNLPLAALTGKILKKIPMKLQHNAGCEWDFGIVPVDRIENIAIAGNLLLRSISGSRFSNNQFLDAARRCRYAFEPVVGFRALDNRRLP